MGNWGMALAGGIGQAGAAYADEQKKQREYDLKQKEAEAEMERKENFARFSQGISQENAKYSQGLTQENDANKATLSRQNATHQSGLTQANQEAALRGADALKGSGYVDPSTKQELTKEELAKRPNGAEGLTPKADFDSQNRTNQAISSSDQKTEHALQKVLDAGFSKDSSEYKEALRKSLGLNALKVDKGTTKAKLNDQLNEYVDAAVKDGVSSETTATLEAYSNLLPEQQEKLKSSPRYKKARRVESAGEEFMDLRRGQEVDKEASREARKKVTKKVAPLSEKEAIKALKAKGASKADIEEILTRLTETGQLEKQSGMGKALSGQYNFTDK